MKLSMLMVLALLGLSNAATIASVSSSDYEDVTTGNTGFSDESAPTQLKTYPVTNDLTWENDTGLLNNETEILQEPLKNETTRHGKVYLFNTTTVLWVPVKGDIHLPSSLPVTYPNASTNYTHYRWLKTRDHPDINGTFHHDLIAPHGNCSYRPNYYGSGMLKCAKNLTLTDTNPFYQGEYVARYVYNNSESDEQRFQVKFFDQRPVLIPAYANRFAVYFYCDDLRSPEASRFIQFNQPKNDYYNEPIWHWEYEHRRDVLRMTIQGYNRQYVKSDHNGMKANLRCCSTIHGRTVCGPWVYMYHNMYLATSSARGRRWCNMKAPLPHVYWGLNAALRSTESTCTRHYFLPTEYEGNVALCENQTSYIVGFNGTVLKQSEYSSEHYHAILKGTRWQIKRPAFNDNGYYKISGKSSQYFAIQVYPRLVVALQLVQMLDTKIVFACNHSADFGRVRWEVKGIYNSYSISSDGQLLTVYPDCWKDYTYWYYKLGVRCTVYSANWYGVSKWFVTEAQRSNYRRCDDFKGYCKLIAP